MTLHRSELLDRLQQVAQLLVHRQLEYACTVELSALCSAAVSTCHAGCAHTT